MLSSDSQHFERVNNTLSDGAVWKHVQSRLEQNSPPPLIFLTLGLTKPVDPDLLSTLAMFASPLRGWHSWP